MAESVLTPELRDVLRARAEAAPEGRPVFARSYVLALLDALEEREAALARVTGEEMVRYLADAAHRRSCWAPGGPEACEVGAGAFVYEAEKVVELIDELAQEEAQDDAQQRSEQAEEAEHRG